MLLLTDQVLDVRHSESLELTVLKAVEQDTLHEQAPYLEVTEILDRGVLVEVKIQNILLGLVGVLALKGVLLLVEVVDAAS